ncbi:lysylphosphatidylglycerol synthase transmembrane domain-containing protein [Naumannella huperziae]
MTAPADPAPEPGRRTVLGRAVGVLRSTWVRVGFLVVAFGLGAWAIVRYRDQLGAAFEQMAPGPLLAALALSVLHVFLTMCAWRVILGGLGSPLPLGDAASMYGVGQVGKYIPGGVWNYLAAAELGADRQVPRRSSVAAMAIATMLNVLVALAIGSLTFVLAPGPLLRDWGWLVWCFVPLLLCLFPPVLNRVIGLAFRVFRLKEPPRPLGYRTLLVATGLAALAWICAGLQLWFLAGDLGLPPTPRNMVMTVSVSALAWAAGLLFLPAPAGVGIREGVTTLALLGALPEGAILLLVLVSRLLLVASDLLFALAGLVITRLNPRPRTARRAGDSDRGEDSP